MQPQFKIHVIVATYKLISILLINKFLIIYNNMPNNYSLMVLLSYHVLLIDKPMSVTSSYSYPKSVLNSFIPPLSCFQQNVFLPLIRCPIQFPFLCWIVFKSIQFNLSYLEPLHCSLCLFYSLHFFQIHISKASTLISPLDI